MEEEEDDMFGCTTPCMHELERYKKEPRLLMKEDPLLWWKLNESRFPKLAVAARDYLAARATSAPSERAFSTGRQVVSEFRKRMTAEAGLSCLVDVLLPSTVALESCTMRHT